MVNQGAEAVFVFMTTNENQSSNPTKCWFVTEDGETALINFFRNYYDEFFNARFDDLMQCAAESEFFCNLESDQRSVLFSMLIETRNVLNAIAPQS